MADHITPEDSGQRIGQALPVEGLSEPSQRLSLIDDSPETPLACIKTPLWIEDEEYGVTLRVEIKDGRSIIKVNRRHYYFQLDTGEYEGCGTDLTEPAPSAGDGYDQLAEDVQRGDAGQEVAA